MKQPYRRFEFVCDITASNEANYDKLVLAMWNTVLGQKVKINNRNMIHIHTVGELPCEEFTTPRPNFAKEAST